MAAGLLHRWVGTAVIGGANTRVVLTQLSCGAQYTRRNHTTVEYSKGLVRRRTCRAYGGNMAGFFHDLAGALPVAGLATLAVDQSWT